MSSKEIVDTIDTIFHYMTKDLDPKEMEILQSYRSAMKAKSFQEKRILYQNVINKISEFMLK